MRAMAGDSAPEILTVSQLTRRVKTLLEREVGAVYVAGEISNWRVSPSGHSYFTLKDDKSQVDCVMFRGRLARLRFEPESGLAVVAGGTVTVYEKRGNYQIVCDEMHPKGLGALQLAFEQLKARLQEEGLFDEAHKKRLPALPRRIGVVTSPAGAAIRDILNVIHRRFANVHVLLAPARVQGDGAAAEIVAGIRMLDAYGVDVMIVGRGGGSLEDLWAFNEEPVVRAVFEARTPVISAVGHEVDFALTDFAADVRAPTPSAAAELVVQEREALLERLAKLRRALGTALGHRARAARGRLELARQSWALRKPEELLRERQQRADDLRERLVLAMTRRVADGRSGLAQANRALGLLSPQAKLQRHRDALVALGPRLARAMRAAVERDRARFRPAVAQLHALSPLRVLGRGYSLTRKDGAVVRSTRGLNRGDIIGIQFAEGSARAAIQETEGETHDG
jgi:exodeoxyribonuclease VII large subunit